MPTNSSGEPPAGATTVDLSGRLVGGAYVLLEAIGGGATGTVWRARHRSTGDSVAVKLLREDLMRRPKMVSRFVQERDILLRLRHPNIVRVRDMPAVGDTLGLVMDLVEGGSLRRYLTDRGTLPPAEAARLLAQVAEALVAAHAIGVVHRDLKPDNILLHREEDGAMTARLTDFGIARVLDTPGITTPEALIGTPNYMAPELIEGRRTSPAADVYAAGILLFELVVGRQPFAGGSALAVLRRHVDYLPPRVPGVHADVAKVVEACLDKRPAKRPTAAELATTLRSLARSTEGVPALPPPAEPTDSGVVRGRAGSLFWDSDPAAWDAELSWPGPGGSGSTSTTGHRMSLVGLGAVVVVLLIAAYLLGGGQFFDGREAHNAVGPPTATGSGPVPSLSPTVGPGPTVTASGPTAPPGSSAAGATTPSRGAGGTIRGGVSVGDSSVDVGVYGQWECGDAYTWNIGHPVIAKACHASGSGVRMKGRLQALPGVQADVTITLVDVATGAMAAGPFRCNGLMFTDFAPEHDCGPFTAAPARGHRYVVLQEWRYTGRSILPGGEAKSKEFTW